MNNSEFLQSLAERGDGSLQAWFDAEHVDSTRSAKRAAAVERLKNSEYHTALDDVCAMLGWGHEPHFEGATAALIDLLTDDGGLTNLEWLFIDSEQFRQAVSAFAFAHSDECPTSPTQMVDWLMAEHVDANDDLAPESDVIAGDVDANDGNATCNNSGENVTYNSREKLEADVREVVEKSFYWHSISHSLFDRVIEWLDRQAAITKSEWAHVHDMYIDDLRSERDELQDELAKRDKGIERLKRQRDTARAKIDELHAECDTCCYKTDYIEMDFYDVDRLEAERDALAADLRDCERQRERLRQALGCAIDHAHEVVSLVTLDGEVIG